MPRTWEGEDREGRRASLSAEVDRPSALALVVLLLADPSRACHRPHPLVRPHKKLGVLRLYPEAWDHFQPDRKGAEGTDERGKQESGSEGAGKEGQDRQTADGV